MVQQTTELAEYLFHQGTNYYAYRFLGCHESRRSGGKYTYTFRVWAPNAISVYVVGDFCDWNEGIPMRKSHDASVWELVYDSDCSLDGKLYKYRVCSKAGVHLKGDPYAHYSRGGADGATVICHTSEFVWDDALWFDHRRNTVCARQGSYLATPLNIYEIHLGSFMKHEDGSYLTYRESADKLAPYLKTMGYTHVELMPITEYPYDRSWGYQVCGFFASTSRYGTPDDLRYFVNKLHSVGIGVLLDWVPAHFPKDGWGLYEFDGGPLYEYQGKDRQESPSWGTRFFDVGRPEVQSFLISSAMYWLEEFHIDGLRVDAVSSMLYLDYDRRPGEWFPNMYGDNKNLESIAFFRKLNSYIFGKHPDVLMIAEESTAFPGITHPSSEGGLGFNLKWNMGWANDFFDYLSMNPVFRKYHHHALNFPIMYAYNENYILPVSHDEVVYGKKSLIDKPFGTYEEKFRQYRTAVMLQATYPGKKMTFMGTEFGQFAEWDFAKGLEWFMLDYPAHRELREYVAALNRFYLENPALWEQDFRPEGFSWIYADDADRNMIAYRRYALDGSSLTVILSFSGSDTTVRMPAREGEVYDVVFSTEGNGEPTPPFKPVRRVYEVTVVPEVKKTEPVAQVKKGGKKKAAEKAVPGVPVPRVEQREEWYYDLPLPYMSGMILRARREDNNTIQL